MLKILHLVKNQEILKKCSWPNPDLDPGPDLDPDPDQNVYLVQNSLFYIEYYHINKEVKRII